MVYFKTIGDQKVAFFMPNWGPERRATLEEVQNWEAAKLLKPGKVKCVRLGAPRVLA